MFQRREGTVGFKQGHTKFGRKIAEGPVICNVLNGGFETGDISNWTVFKYKFNLSVDAVMNGAQEGSYYARCDFSDRTILQSGTARVYQTVLNCTPSDTKFHFWYRTINTFGNMNNIMRAGVGSCWSMVLQYPIGWTEVDATIPAGCTYGDHTVSFSFSGISGLTGWADIYLDLDDIYFYS